MILTGKEIEKQVENGNIIISPFYKEQLNPNSYNYRLGSQLLVPKSDSVNSSTYEEVEIPDQGYLLKPGCTYLGHTYETLGSDIFAMSLIGRSSIGRLGLFLQVSANLGHIGSCHSWTLELVAINPIVVYPFMKIGQISFWKSIGDINHYKDGYTKFNQPYPSIGF
ncbi:dCTP deaminase [Acinetobacter sp. ACIN00229]|uniref:dCTP deaminase n=1 Tax=Acinetobacter sp. ACIN00229 TaxID=2792607 RepID=UPI0018DEFCAA|nr:dCTP deaminase [Acinetobacter sp. ACIN00229]MBI0421284.1 dCTP deaminase [Acinetobacter sp. ACIN00229]